MILDIIPRDGTRRGYQPGVNRFYQRPPEFSVPALQLSYDDKAGRFPCEPGYAAPDMQPRPGTFRA